MSILHLLPNHSLGRYKKDTKQQQLPFSVISRPKIISENDAQLADDQGQLFYIHDSRFDCDITDYEGDDTNRTRGDYPYKRPAWWNRKAVRVKGKCEDAVWLGEKGWRDESSPGQWAVSYHRTKIQHVPSIVAGGYDTNKSVFQAYGPGIYSTPDVKVAEDYATDFNYKEENYKCILQNRVNINKTKQQKTDHGMYFVTPDDNDIRPYGLCIKKI